MSMSDLQRKIKEARDARNWSQRDLAQRMGVSQQTVAHWENGGLPRGGRLDALYKVLGVNAMRAEAEAVVTSPVAPDTSARPLPVVRTPSIEHVRASMDQIREMHRHRSLAQPPGQPLAAQEQDRLRVLRVESLLHALMLRGAQGRIEGVLAYGSFSRRHAYVSARVVAEVGQIADLSDTKPLSSTRFAAQILRLAVAKSARPELYALLLLVVEAGDIDAVRLLADRLYADCRLLNVHARIVPSYEGAADVIVGAERMTLPAASPEDEDPFGLPQSGGGYNIKTLKNSVDFLKKPDEPDTTDK